ncbi:MAG: 50S ribosomal protein L25 [Sphaerobacteraceae bacterium]|nr:MAG: 50S ribosomal protein L25 [Sphaerobacteraceae bacterium]
MVEHRKLTAEPREVLGKKVKQLRRDGILPAVVYGPMVEGADSVQVDGREFGFAFRDVGYTSLIDLSVGSDKSIPVFVREVQVHPVRRDILHIDFYAPNMRLPVEANVPVSIVGELADEVEAELTLGLFEVTVSALPDSIPDELQADISGLKEIGDQITASELPFPEGVEFVGNDDDLIVKLDPIREEEEEPEEEVAEGEEPEVVGEDEDADGDGDSEEE